MQMIDATLVLEDGRCFTGRSFAAPLPDGDGCVGEVVFNTAMSGYAEVITDPSYAQQIVVMTATQIGNYGFCLADAEAARPRLSALVVKEVSRIASNWRSDMPLAAFLQQHNIVGLCEVETRALVLHLRACGALRGVLISGWHTSAPALALQRARALALDADWVGQVSTPAPYAYAPETAARPSEAAPLAVCVLDFGVKRAILRCLSQAGCAVTVLPATTSAAEVLRRQPAGVVLSNGPGDPTALPGAVQTVRQLLGKVPLLGICLGHQLLGLAVGGHCRKLKYGHRGSNHPVQQLATGKVAITAQNHGYSIDAASLPKTVQDATLQVTHMNLNDQTLAGIAIPALAACSVQYHPEASPGPHDAREVWPNFMQTMRRFAAAPRA